MGVELGEMEKQGQQQGILQLQVPLLAMAWVGEPLWLSGTAPFLGCPQHLGVLKLECPSLLHPGGCEQGLGRLLG